MYSNPVLVVVLAWAIRREAVRVQGCAGIVVTLLGVVLVAQPPFLFGGHEWSHERMIGKQPPAQPTRLQSFLSPFSSVRDSTRSTLFTL
jgi:drug/metabolite transporter (DMT)-like permease